VIVVYKERIAQILSVVVVVSGSALAISSFIPVLSKVSNYLLVIFVISVHLKPWIEDGNIWFRRSSILGLVIYVLTILFSSIARMIIIPVVTTLVILWGGMLIGTNAPKDKTVKPGIRMPEPAKRQGTFVTNFAFIGSQVLTLFNPFQLAQMAGQIFGLVVVLIRYKGKLPTVDSYDQQVQYYLPIQGEWFVANGGITKETSHSWDIFNQRYAYDLVIMDDKLSTHNGKGKSCSDYYCYQKSIIAPADGIVVKVTDGVRDAKHPGTMALDFMAKDFRGNHLIIKHSDQEYSFLAHFIPGSITVKIGEMVEQGQLLGKCGNSGHSTEPHLHFHIQDRASFFSATGLPVKFSELKIDGQYQRSSYLSKGQVVSAQH